MKKRIGTLYNKPIIEGDINLKTPNEIYKDELKGGGGKDTGPKYYLSKDKLHMVTYQTSNIFEKIGNILWKCALIVRGKSNELFGGRGCMIGAFMDGSSNNGGDHMDGIMIDLNLSGIIYIEGANVKFSYDSISEFIYEMLLLSETIQSGDTTVTKEVIDNYINSILVEVTKEQFFDFNYTLIKE